MATKTVAQVSTAAPRNGWRSRSSTPNKASHSSLHLPGDLANASAASVPRVARSPLIQPDKTATLAVTFTKKGKYRYLCTVPGHAALGMRGVFAVR
jgi:plastocyanin